MRSGRVCFTITQNMSSKFGFNILKVYKMRAIFSIKGPNHQACSRYPCLKSQHLHSGILSKAARYISTGGLYPRETPAPIREDQRGSVWGTRECGAQSEPPGMESTNLSSQRKAPAFMAQLFLLYFTKCLPSLRPHWSLVNTERLVNLDLCCEMWGISRRRYLSEI